MRMSIQVRASILVCLIWSSFSSWAATEHDNTVDFSSWPSAHACGGSQVNSIVFYYTGEYSVTDGQPWDGVTTNNITSQKGGVPTYQVDVFAGRKASQPPADFFIQRAGTINIGVSGAAQFDALNFALTGVLEIEGNDYQVVIGQVGVMAGEPNNIWYLGPNESGFNYVKTVYSYDQCEYLTTPDGKYRIGMVWKTMPNSYTFYVSKSP